MTDIPSKNRDANENVDEVLIQAAKMTVGGSANLPTLASLTFAADATSFVIVPESADDDIRFAIGGAASANSPRVAANGEWFSMTKAVADLFTLFNAAGSKAVGLRVYGPRT